jgi:serine/threonine-protein kinase
MAPEQVRAHPVDGRTDIWALGAILYELVTGRLAYDGMNVTQICANILSATSPPLASECCPDIPASLDATIARCLAHEPEGRFSTVAELAESLRAFASRRTVRTIESIVNRGSDPGRPARPISGIAVRPSLDAVKLPSALKQSTRRARALLVVLTAAVALVGIGTVLLRAASVAPPAPAAGAPIVERALTEPAADPRPVARPAEPPATTTDDLAPEESDAPSAQPTKARPRNPERLQAPRKPRGAAPPAGTAPRDGTAIRRIVQAARSTYYCPACQR